MATSENLKRLATAFTVRDIMVKTRDLVCATDQSEAVYVSKSNLDFSFIPIRSANGFSAYFCRDSEQVSPIGVQDLVSDGTGILDLVEVLEHREFAFVQGMRQIDGYVHFSDLNSPLVKLTFYMLLEGVERFALESVKPRLTEDYLKAGLSASRFEQVRRSYTRAGDAGQSLANYLNIADTLTLAHRAGTLKVDESMIQAVRRARNGAAHVSENLVSDYGDVKKLAQVKTQCLQVLRSAEGN